MLFLINYPITFFSKLSAPSMFKQILATLLLNTIHDFAFWHTMSNHVFGLFPPSCVRESLLSTGGPM